MTYETGKQLISQKQYKKAFSIFSKLLKDKPNDFKVNFQMGKLYYELNDLNKSVFHFKKSNETQPKNPNILFNLALALRGVGKMEEAKKIYLNLISINIKDVKSYYGLFVLDINLITNEFYENLKMLIKEDKISLFEKSLINFMFSKFAKKNGK